MAEIGRWNGHVFEVSPGAILSWTELSVKTGIETETKKTNKRQYVARKHATPGEADLTVLLDARLGIDVRGEAESLLAAAADGEKDYFYIGGKKLLPCKMMLTKAELGELEILNDEWVKCEVRMTLMQASKYDGDTGGSSGGSGKKSSKKTSVKKNTAATNTANYTPLTLANMSKHTVQWAPSIQKVNKAVNEIDRLRTQAKDASKKVGILMPTKSTHAAK